MKKHLQTGTGQLYSSLPELNFFYLVGKTSIMIRFLPFLACSIFMVSGCNQAPESNNQETKESSLYFAVDSFDERLQEWVGDSAEVEILAEGFTWSEGPVWLENEQMVLFSDVPANTIHAWSETNGLTTYLNPSGYTDSLERGGEMGSNGLILDNEGRLLLCQHGDRRVARMNAPLDNPQPQFETLAARYDGKRFNSPNDLVQAADGSVYFTDPPYGLESQMDDPAKELPFQGVYKITPEGEILLQIDSITRPNGIEISADGQSLYLGNSDRERPYWYRYTISGDSLTNGEIFADPTSFFEGAGGSDGMVVADDGTLISTGHGGLWFIRPDGTVLGRIQVPQAVANCTLDASENFLYVTAHTQLLRIRLR